MLKFTASGLILLTTGVFVGLSPLTFAGGPPPGKPVQQEPATQQAPQTTPTQNQAETNLPPRFPLPSARVASVDGLVTLRLVNNTNAVIQYQVVGGTRERVLGQQSTVELQVTPPSSVTYQRQDNGLLLVFPKATKQGVLEVRFEPTNDLNLDTKSLNINESGSVFLN